MMASEKDAALRRIDVEQAQWQETVAEVGEDRMDEPGPMGDWTFRDLVAHLTGWRSYSVARLEAVARGEADAPLPWPPVLTTDDEINAWIRDTAARQSLADVLADYDATFGRLRAVVEALPDDTLADAGATPWMNGASIGEAIVSGRYFDHWHEEHEPEVRAWLNAKASDPG